MPNYDLGTAHGRVKIDADTRGADSATRAVKSFDRVLGGIARAISGFSRRMDEMERELRAVTDDLQAAERAADQFDRSMGHARGTTVAWNKDLKDLHERLRGVSHAAATYGPAAVQVGRFVRAFRGTDDIRMFGTNLNIAQRALRSFVTIGGIGYLLDTMRSKFFGVGVALQHVTGRQRQVLQFASSFRTLTFGVGIIGALATKTGVAQKAISKLVDVMAPLDHILKNAYPRMEKFGSAAIKVWKNLESLSGNVIQTVSGFALMSHGLRQLTQRFGFFNRMPPLFKAGLAGMAIAGEAAFETIAKGLIGVSNLLVSALSAVKQLAGGFLVLPGAIAMAVTGFGMLKFIVSGLKDAFADIFKAKDATEMAEAVKALPEALRPTGQALADVLPKWKALKNEILGTFVSGAPEQIRAISDSYLPKMRAGVLQVSNAWRIAKDHLVDFLKTSETQRDFNTLFSNTSQVMNQLSMNLVPILNGLRDIGTVGTAFIRDMSAGVPAIAEGFERWARSTGNTEA